ncbi:hypothetical protein SEA_CHUPACABRA_64 [Mycobacterium phage Chupacabra]|uniref:Uncharacterized protein n=2 Tax=Fromanvirus goose TaxID=1211282 RepID=A0A6B9LGW2_9CAUD|nr:hypothetical protein FGG46_gp27 [Mycobacterium phage Goose]AFU20690.1 hypothetical protein GOOSE_67 [Mycobacterium phage Goose]QHB41247.1 hypothetical protein SEA_CHUPACABRA_64 [Mycobacterium phage Chupacabra]
MTEYRKGVTLSTETEYWHVELGGGEVAYPFPSVEAATRFAQGHTHRAPVIRFPDGRRWNGKEWL